MKGLFIFLLTTLFSSLAAAQELGRHVDYNNPKAGDYIPLDYFITFGCMDVVPDQAKRFDELMGLMRVLGDWKLCIEVHTDCRSAPHYNDSISQAKADTFKAFFISHGFPAWRLEAKGMGERMLYVPKCSYERTDAGNRICEEKEHQLNRRTLIRLVEKIEWTGTEPLSMEFPSPGQFRMYPGHPRLYGEDQEVEMPSVYSSLDSFRQVYLTIHRFPGPISFEILSYKKRKKEYYHFEEARTFSGFPSRIRIVHHRYGETWQGMKEGFVVVIDSVLNKSTILSDFDLEIKEEAFIYDIGYWTTEGDGPQWEPVPIGGFGFFHDIDSSEKTYCLWIITTDYPEEVYAMHRKKEWKLTQDTTPPDLTLFYDYFKRLSADGYTGADRIKEVRYKHVPGVHLPCMFILIPKEE